MQKAILALESPWEKVSYGSRSTTILPFLTGLERVYADLDVHYSTFFERVGFERGLEYVLSGNEDRRLLYIAAHGCSGDGYVNGATIAEDSFRSLVNRLGKHGRIKNKVEGIVFGCCEVGELIPQMVSILDKRTFLAPCWIFAYRHAIDWLPSTLIDTVIMQMFLSGKRMEEKEFILKKFVRALSCFNGRWEMATDLNGDGSRMPLRESIVLLARDERWNNAVNLTDDLIKELGWSKD